MTPASQDSLLQLLSPAGLGKRPVSLVCEVRALTSTFLRVPLCFSYFSSTDRFYTSEHLDAVGTYHPQEKDGDIITGT
jgi:hypothetical protein